MKHWCQIENSDVIALLFNIFKQRQFLFKSINVILKC